MKHNEHKMPKNKKKMMSDKKMKSMMKKKRGYDFKAAEKKLGVVY